MSRRFDKALEQATDQTLVEPFWEAILECVDLIRGLDVPVKTALAAIQKRVHHENPHVAHHALLVLEACVKNCGKKFHAVIATKEFMDDLKNIVIDGAPDKVKNKILELIQCWASAFEKYPQYKIVCDTHSFMRMYGFEFPKLKEADAMFMADSAPEWADGENCFRCRVEFGVFTRKHHCRNCGQIFCDRCSNRQMLLPQFGIEKRVRVCESCYTKRESTVPAKTDQKTPDVDEAKVIAESKAAEEARLRALKEKEEEDLQLALAISQSEAEAKEKEKQSGFQHHFDAAPSHSELSIYQGVATSEKDSEHDTDPVLSRYLDRKYWEQRQQARDQNDQLASAPPQSELSFSMASSQGNGIANGQTHALNATPTQDSHFLAQQMGQLTVKPLESDDVEQTSAFCAELKECVEVMSNRMLSNLKRGRSIVNDSAIHSLFRQLTEKHADVLGRINKLENEREYYEGLQDQLAHIQEARQAVNALREEHERQRQQRLAEEQRQRQQQMQVKLEVMRQKKHDMLMQQRHQALQRFQEQEAQIQQRRLHAHGGHSMYAPQSQYQGAPGMPVPMQYGQPVYPHQQQQQPYYNPMMMPNQVPPMPPAQYGAERPMYNESMYNGAAPQPSLSQPQMVAPPGQPSVASSESTLSSQPSQPQMGAPAEPMAPMQPQQYQYAYPAQPYPNQLPAHPDPSAHSMPYYPTPAPMPYYQGQPMPGYAPQQPVYQPSPYKPPPTGPQQQQGPTSAPAQDEAPLISFD